MVLLTLLSSCDKLGVVFLADLLAELAVEFLNIFLAL
jgi:hypothetical protein